MSTVIPLPADAIARWRDAVADGYEGRRPLDDPAVRGAVEATLAELDAGRLRVASKEAEGWVTHGYCLQAVIETADIVYSTVLLRS